MRRKLVGLFSAALLVGVLLAGFLAGFGSAHPFGFPGGTPGEPNCNGKVTSTLARMYGGFEGAADQYGMSVQGLHDAIQAFCDTTTFTITTIRITTITVPFAS